MYAGAHVDIACLVDEVDYLYFTRWLWKPQYNKGKIYFCRTQTVKTAEGRFDKKVYLHVEILTQHRGGPPTRLRRFGDHLNGDSLDNRLSNLRWATRFENNRNRFGAACREISLCQN